MSTLTVTTNGQVTLDRELLQHLGAVPGDTVRVEKRPDGVIEVRAAHARTGRIGDAFGILGHGRTERAKDVSSVFDRLQQDDGPHLTIEQMNAIIADGWAGEIFGRIEARCQQALAFDTKKRYHGKG